MRLMSVVALIASIAFGFLAVLRPASDNANDSTSRRPFSSRPSPPKALQKFAEARFPSSG